MKDVVEAYLNIDPKDPEQLKSFFLAHSFFSTVDLASILKFSPGHIRRLKRRAGVGKGPSPELLKRLQVPKRIVLDDIAPFEDTPEWWQIHAKKYGLVKLMRASGLGKTATRRRMAKYAPAKRIGKISHECCNYDWLHKYYIQKKWSTAKCAELAGVTHETIVSWLIIHGIGLRKSFRGPFV